MKFSQSLFGVASLALGCVTGFAQNALQVVTDRESWRAAAGGEPVFFVDFNQYTADVPAAGRLNLGPLALVPYGAWSTTPLIDAPPLRIGNIDNTAGVTARLVGGAGMWLEIEFAQPIQSFGFDYDYSMDADRPMTVTTSTGESHTFQALWAATRFIGFIAREPFTKVSLTSINNIDPLLDNFEAREVVITTVPEVHSITRLSPQTRDAMPEGGAGGKVTFRVTFSMPVVHVDIADFRPVGPAAAGAFVSEVALVEDSESAAYDVTVSNITVEGELGLEVVVVVTPEA